MNNQFMDFIFWFIGVIAVMVLLVLGIVHLGQMVNPQMRVQHAEAESKKAADH